MRIASIRRRARSSRICLGVRRESLPRGSRSCPLRVETSADKRHEVKQRRCRRRSARTRLAATLGEYLEPSAPAQRRSSGRRFDLRRDFRQLASRQVDVSPDVEESPIRDVLRRIGKESRVTPRSASRLPARHSFRGRTLPIGPWHDSRTGPLPRESAFGVWRRSPRRGSRQRSRRRRSQHQNRPFFWPVTNWKARAV